MSILVDRSDDPPLLQGTCHVEGLNSLTKTHPIVTIVCVIMYYDLKFDMLAYKLTISMSENMAHCFIKT